MSIKQEKQEKLKALAHDNKTVQDKTNINLSLLAGISGLRKN